MNRLLLLQSVWGLDNCPGFDIWNDLENALELVLAAGFDGVGTNIARVERTATVSRFMGERGRPWEGQVMVHDAGQLAASIETADRLGAHHLNVQIAGPIARVRDAVALIDTLVDAAKDAPLPVYFETHRGRLTNDLLFTLRLLEARPDLPITGDLSHYPVAGEMELPLREDQQIAVDRILRNCRAFHGRVSSTHQVQIALAAPQHRQWLDQFLSWWRTGFEYWLARASDGSDLPFMCELGPPPYAITTPEGHELTDRWVEAQEMKDMVRTLWREAIDSLAPTGP